jgi:hypothetical protein
VCNNPGNKKWDTSQPHGFILLLLLLLLSSKKKGNNHMDLWPTLMGLLDLHIETFWQDSLDRGSAQHKASTNTGKHNTETHGHTFMPEAGFEPAVLMFERS